MSERLIPLTCIIVAAIVVGIPADAQPLTGANAQVMITGPETIDPPANQKNDRAAVFLSGEAARKIYEAMPGATKRGDACEEGLRLRQSGGLVCTKHQAGQYACSVAIILQTGETRSVGAC
ncbi:hypothetical protein HL653_21785 [Sphingomonas sp. AP4-R1]|uniref:hypothetical protein n=1 Tax=Sphingomonas sp. AP4-R1 TaxID=2735134 RepID=UPI001493D292|nr:hypothetical protein [Sphingomonas sp. AP4-R1]QJU60016.1 hypothetical protein HL653_21785 [Sphingomonas sp. AP4-R1]